MKLILSGGGQKDGAVWEEEWSHYNKAILASIDWKTGLKEQLITYVSPPNVVAGKDANIIFKAGTLHGDLYYVCTQTEVLIYKLPTFELIKNISLPCFNDIHHVIPFGEKLAIVSTGLDLVVILDKNHSPERYINVLGMPEWERFSIQKDYRKVLTTKPHHSHPNFIFEIDGELWVTRFEQKDAIMLSDQKQRIDIGYERVHDGIVKGDFVFFTTVNGTVCVTNKNTYKKEAVYDLNDAYVEDNPLGWCRSLYVNDDKFYIGFSSLRSTKVRENLAWIKRGFKASVSESRALPTRVVEYDFNNKRIIQEVELTDVGMSAIFSIMADE
jgi:hypothetical protein